MDSELQKAIAWVDSGPVVVGAKHINALAEAAREWERLGLTRCDTCGGSGWVSKTASQFEIDNNVTTDLEPSQMMSFPCDNCSGLGWLIPDTMIEAVVKPLIDFLTPRDHQGTGLNTETYRMVAKAALVAAFTVTEAPDGQ